ncbi:ABC transporter permease [Nonomuraea sp. NPDC046570]|uniref:ABC transporter permease n=1 Tax=Nonomuraea sp. NPDC046570 TaxID=3155255 RepID=UPI00340083CF
MPRPSPASAGLSASALDDPPITLSDALTGSASIAPATPTEPVDPPVPVVRSGSGARIAGRVVRSSAAIVMLALVWETLPRLAVVDPTFLPPLSEVALAWADLLSGGELAEHVQASLIRSLAGFGLAIVAAIPLGLLIGWYRPVADFLNPALELFRNTAALALLPVFVLVLGLGETSKISIILYACSWPILLNTIAGVKGVDPLLIKSARSMGLTPYRLFQKVILPAAVPTVFTGIRLAGAYSILVLVAAEMVGAKAGLGYLINYAQYNFRVPDMYAGIITISVLGLLFNLLLIRLERRFSTWRTP